MLLLTGNKRPATKTPWDLKLATGNWGKLIIAGHQTGDYVFTGFCLSVTKISENMMMEFEYYSLYFGVHGKHFVMLNSITR